MSEDFTHHNNVVNSIYDLLAKSGLNSVECIITMECALLRIIQATCDKDKQLFIDTIEAHKRMMQGGMEAILTGKADAVQEETDRTH